MARSLWDWDEKVPPNPSQTIKQVWFAGAHSDVGGGYAEPGLSDIAFNWMMRSAERSSREPDPRGAVSTTYLPVARFLTCTTYSSPCVRNLAGQRLVEPLLQEVWG